MQLERGDAKVLVQHLSELKTLQEDVEKLKRLVALKMDKGEAERALAIRITRNELFTMLTTMFPSNVTIQKAIQTSKKKLPPLAAASGDAVELGQDRGSRATTPSTMGESSHDRGSRTTGPSTVGESSHDRGGRAFTSNARESGQFEGTEETYHVPVHHRRQIQTATPQPLVPGRDSRLLALNQKYLKGADGRYYLKDLGVDTSISVANVVGSQSRTDIAVDQAFDFQPFLPAAAVEPEKVHVPPLHRAQEPTEGPE
jgi:hypothetical protein